MTDMPVVLGLYAQDAERRLAECGFSEVEIRVSGRRREGRARVMRQKQIDGKVELIVSHFKELGGAADEIPPVT